LTVDLVPDPDGATVVVTGDLDLATARSLTTAALGAVDSSEDRLLTLDLSGVGFCDSAGINALVDIRQSVVDQGWRLRVIRLQPAVHRVLVDFTGLGEYLDVR
jgi:anti-anti-sigma factor